MSDEYFSGPATGPAAAPVWELSGWWRRVGAYMIDGLIVWIPLSIVLAVTGIGSNTDTSNGNFAFNIDGVGIVLQLVVSAVYFMAVMTAWNGQTVGKQVTGIRVVREDGQKIDPWFAFYRQTLVMGILFGWIAALTLYIATFLNYLWPLWDDKHQALHDKIVHSRVVLAQPVGDPGALQAAQAQAGGFPAGYPPAPPVPPQPPYGAPQAPPAPPATPYAPPTPYTPPAAPAQVPPTQVPPASGQPGPATPSPGPPPPPAPPAPGGTPAPYAPPPGFDNPVPDDE